MTDFDPTSALTDTEKAQIAKQKLDPWSTLTYPQGAATVGDKLFDVSYVDGATTIRWIYHLRNTGTELFRCMVI